MFKHEYYLLSMFEKAGSIRGRKKLQKMVHLLKQKGLNVHFRYRYHHFGPYSAELQTKINDMVEQEFLQESPDNGAYKYTLTEKGKEFKAKLDQFFTENDPVIPAYFEPSIRALEDKTSPFLEVASTYAFLLETETDKQVARDKTKELKPHLVDMLDEAVMFYEQFMQI